MKLAANASIFVAFFSRMFSVPKTVSEIMMDHRWCIDLMFLHFITLLYYTVYHSTFP